MFILFFFIIFFFLGFYFIFYVINSDASEFNDFFDEYYRSQDDSDQLKEINRPEIVSYGKIKRETDKWRQDRNDANEDD